MALGIIASNIYLPIGNYQSINLEELTIMYMQARYFTEATKEIASMPSGHCLGALEMLR